jgi:hypothetical protein
MEEKKHMKSIIAVTVLVLLMFSARGAGADSFKTLNQNEFITADSIDAGMTQAGVFFTLGESYRSYYPSFRFGLGALAEVGVKAGASTIDTGPEDKAAVLLGADVKYQLIKQTEGIPVDMAIDLGFDTHIIGDKNVSEVSFSTIFSRSFPLTERGYKVTPYGGLELSALYGSYLSNNETDFYVFAGVEWKLTQKAMFFAEVKTGDHTLGGIGIRFEY